MMKLVSFSFKFQKNFFLKCMEILHIVAHCSQVDTINRFKKMLKTTFGAFCLFIFVSILDKITIFFIFVYVGSFRFPHRCRYCLSTNHIPRSHFQRCLWCSLTIRSQLIRQGSNQQEWRYCRISTRISLLLILEKSSGKKKTQS